MIFSVNSLSLLHRPASIFPNRIACIHIHIHILLSLISFDDKLCLYQDHQKLDSLPPFLNFTTQSTDHVTHVNSSEKSQLIGCLIFLSRNLQLIIFESRDITRISSQRGEEAKFPNKGSGLLIDRDLLWVTIAHRLDHSSCGDQRSLTKGGGGCSPLVTPLVLSLFEIYNKSPWSILYCSFAFFIFFLVGYVEERLWWPIQSPNIGGKKNASS